MFLSGFPVVGYASFQVLLHPGEWLFSRALLLLYVSIVGYLIITSYSGLTVGVSIATSSITLSKIFPIVTRFNFDFQYLFMVFSASSSGVFISKNYYRTSTAFTVFKSDPNNSIML